MDRPSTKRLLGGLSPDRFLAEYWQQKPLLIRAAWPGFSTPLSPEELAGLACEDGVNARLVQGFGKRWRVRHGPFQSQDFISLPEQRWTVLIPDVEKHLPELRSILEPFRFIPDWRIDDLMVSYAAPQGSVGPHVDAYDVFLLQGMGRRRWQVGANNVRPDNYLPHNELCLLRDFSAEQEWVLEAGDMLYLPPGVPHYGLALEACMTFSIGFRAPAISDLVADFCEYLIQRCVQADRLSDPGLPAGQPPGQIAPYSLAQIQNVLNRQLSFSPLEVRHWFGRFITEAQAELAPIPLEPPLQANQLAQHLQQYPHWQRDASTRFAYTLEPMGAITVYIDTHMYPLESPYAWLGELICNRVNYRSTQLQPALDDTRTESLLLEWINQAYLLPIYHDQQSF